MVKHTFKQVSKIAVIFILLTSDCLAERRLVDVSGLTSKSSLDEILKEIENQSDYRFFMSSTLVQHIRHEQSSGPAKPRPSDIVVDPFGPVVDSSKKGRVRLGYKFDLNNLLEHLETKFNVIFTKKESFFLVGLKQ